MSTFEKALDQWTAVSLPRLQHDLDTRGEEIQNLQSSTLESRKLLASKTKEFKKLDEELKTKEFKHLLKQYQQEIDTLTERAKVGEQAFFEVYKAIAELPDPKPLLEASLDSVIASQEVQELREKNEELQSEVLKYADYEQIKAKLLRLEQKSAETLTNRLKLQEEELSAQFKEKEAQWAQKEEGWTKKITELNSSVKELKTQQKVDKLKLKNQRIALGEDPDADDDEPTTIDTTTTATSHELESLRKESEFKEKRVQQLEARNSELYRELTRAKSDAEAREAKLAQELKLSELESENASLVAQLEHFKSQSESGERSKNTQINGLQREVNTLSSELTSLKNKLSSYRDYDEIKKELNTLRAISFGSGDDSESGEDDEQDPVKSSSTQLDEILAQRNKKLTAEIADFRSKQSQMLEKIAYLEQELKKSQQETIKIANLNTQLESDLQQLDQAAAKYDTMSMISGVTRATTRTSVPTPSSSNRRLSPASSIAGGVIPEEGVSEASASVLPIITSQRDRFRARNNELESQLKKQATQITELRSQITKLKKDNTSLVEKTRYLSSFQGSVRRGGSNNPDPETQYDESYEESLHPLARFRQKEQERVASRLSPLERIFLSFAKAILANKTSRMLFLGYCVGLHGVVMMMSIYVMSLHGASVQEVGVVDKSATVS